MSGGGDGTLKLWNWATGDIVFNFELMELIEQQELDKPAHLIVSSITGHEDVVAVAFERYRGIFFFHLLKNKLEFKEFLCLPAFPLFLMFEQKKVWISLDVFHDEKESNELVVVYQLNPLKNINQPFSLQTQSWNGSV